MEGSGVMAGLNYNIGINFFGKLQIKQCPETFLMQGQRAEKILAFFHVFPYIYNAKRLSF
jgi:hypothetical protein